MTRRMPATALVDGLADLGIRLVSSVPCSFFAGPLRLLESGYPGGIRHVPAVNEGSAVAIAAGASLAGESAAVLVQNSGFGNLINPLTSLVLPHEIPLLVLMSMRGWPTAGPGEQQHRWMGQVAESWLDSLGLPHWFLPGGDTSPEGEGGDEQSPQDVLASAGKVLANRQTAFVLVPRGAIGDAPEVCPRLARRSGPTRGEVVRALLAEVTDQHIVSTTGYLSRELFSQGDRPGNFYMQGSMGHAAGVALGGALARPGARFVILDGDGAALMHLGTLATVGHFRPANLTHLVFDNGGYESTGAQPTAAAGTDFRSVARACGYRQALAVATASELVPALRTALRGPGPAIVVVRGSESPATGGRATEKVSPAEIADRFSDSLAGAASPAVPPGVPAAPGAAAVVSRPGLAPEPDPDQFARIAGRPGTYFGRGAVRSLGQILDRLSASRVLVVRGGRSYYSSGAAAAISALAGRFQFRYFADVPPNPALEDVVAGVAVARDAAPDVVVGIGGGSVMDMAKAVAVLAPQDAPPLTCLWDPGAIAAPRRGLVLVPTTCGSGSELTRFATIYAGLGKHSLESGQNCPDAAIIDPDLSGTAPVPVAAAAGADALSQAIESAWAVAGTDASRALARQAADLLLPALGAATGAAGFADPSVHADLALGAALAGAAIDTSRTTGAHALSYALTARRQIPHGLAVALHLRWLIGHNAAVAAADCRYPGGPAALRALVGDLQERCRVATSGPVETLLARLLALGGGPATLSALELDLDRWLPVWAATLTSARALNNPRLVTIDDVAGAICGRSGD
jgi:phosphonopyruvate decarboxylase